MVNYLRLILVVIEIVVFCSVTSGKINNLLQDIMKKGDKVNILVNFNGTGDICRLGDRTVRTKLKDSRANHLSLLRQDLTLRMQESQGSLLEMLTSQKTKSPNLFSHFTQFWVTNQMIIGKADPKLIEDIANDPSVTSIEEEPEIELLQFPEAKPNENDKPQSNLHQVKAPATWEEFGTKGQGITIGFLDTGVLHSHETLKKNWLGEYGWFDPISGRPEPWDELGHGTYVTAIAVGAKGIGVAPGAKWSACRICSGNFDDPCPLEAILQCAQFMTCPTTPNGTAHDCSKAPQIINNSWGGRQQGSTTYFDEMIQCWRAAGMIPVFAGGNSGPECGSAQYPGFHKDVITVGNVGKDGFGDIYLDIISGGSSRGPTPDGRIKPDIVAPGTFVTSASNEGDNMYNNRLSGTSHAAPHVAGGIALVLSKYKGLDYDEVKEMLLKSTDQIVQPPDVKACESIPLQVFPNHVVGHGRLNILKFAQAVKANKTANYFKISG